MRPSIVARLDAINRDFYRTHADEFSRTRSRPWPGWRRVFELVKRHHDRTRVSVLDLGCGNGRALPELSGVFGESLEYLGTDTSLRLLAEAQARRHERARFCAFDLVDTETRALGSEARFDLIVAFGLLHHLPSFELRRRLLEQSAALLAAGGFLAVSFWQFGAKERFRERTLKWAERGFEPGELEAGDHLLAWGNGGAARYCHYAPPDEASRLLESLKLTKVDAFASDGKSADLNLYYVLRRGLRVSGAT